MRTVSIAVAYDQPQKPDEQLGIPLAFGQMLDRERRLGQARQMTTRWWPATAAEIENAAASGELHESHSLDVKRDLEPGDKGNRALAIDLASFAVDGGVLVIGVDEGPPAKLSPVRLDGLKERIDQVARSRLDPPLAVTVRTIASEADPSLGYVVVVIPASPAAPHMVENRYLGRGDTTNTRLGDADVRRIHAGRSAALQGVGDLLDAEVLRDPVPTETRLNGHIFVVAQPVFGPAELLESAVKDMRKWMFEIRHVRPLEARFAPDVTELSQVQRRAKGWALTSLDVGRVPPEEAHRESGLIDVEVNEDGGVRLFCGRGSERLRHRPDDPAVVYTDIHAAMAWRVAQIAERISATTRYVGNWDFGYAATGMLGSVEYVETHRGWSDGTRYSDDIYQALTTATYSEIADGREAIVARLVGRLHRGLMSGRYQPIREGG